MASELKKKTVRKIIPENIESLPKTGRQSTAPKKTRKSAKKGKTPFDIVKKDVEYDAIDLTQPKKDENQIFPKDAKFVQVNILGVHLIAKTLNFYAKDGWSYLETAINLNGTCWVILEKLEEE